MCSFWCMGSCDQSCRQGGRCSLLRLEVSATLVKLIRETMHLFPSLPFSSFLGHHLRRVVQMNISGFGVFHVMHPRNSQVMFNASSNLLLRSLLLLGVLHFYLFFLIKRIRQGWDIRMQENEASKDKLHF